MSAIIPEPTINDPARTKEQLLIWIDAVNAMLKAHHKGMKYEVTIGTGRKYIKIWEDKTGGGIFAFIRAADGAILKPANMKAPTLNHIRGSIFDSDVTKALNRYGVRDMDDPALHVGQ